MWYQQSRPGLVTRKLVYSSRNAHFKITPLSDIHQGSIAHSTRLFDKTVSWIAADPQHFSILMGDTCDLVTYKDTRFHPADVAEWLRGSVDIAQDQIDRFLSRVSPIRGKILGYVQGNHEDTLYRYTERDVYSAIGRGLKTDAEEKLLLGHTGFIRISFTRTGGSTYTLVLYVTHGYWGGRLMGVGALNLERVLSAYEADIVLAGHDHNTRMFMSGKTKSTAHGIKSVPIGAISCGHFLDRPLYGQRRGYKWKPPGSVTIHVWPDKKRWSVEIPSTMGLVTNDTT